MKNIDAIVRILRFTLIIIVLGFFMQGVTAQSKKEIKDKKKTRVEVRIIKEDDKGNVVKIDTAYEVDNAPSCKMIVKKIELDRSLKREDGQDREITVHVTSDMEGNDSLAQEVQTIVLMDDQEMDMPDHRAMQMEMMFPGMEDAHPNIACPGIERANETFPWGMGMTPWGQITKFEVKDKKHGKRITIETNDENMMLMPPPPPPPPPHMKMQKKIMMEKGEGSKPGNEKVIIIKKKKENEQDRNE